MRICVTVVHKPRRAALIRRGIQAQEYFGYCQEVGCDVWEQLLAMAMPDREPLCLWLPDDMIVPGTSRYVQGTEVPDDCPVPQGFEKIWLPESDYLQFQGQPFAEADFGQAIAEVWNAMADFDPGELGFAWNEDAPRIQLEPQCRRGYIELKAVQRIGF